MPPSNTARASAAGVLAGAAVAGAGAIHIRARSRRREQRRYRLRLDEPLDAGVGRVLGGRFDTAIDELEHRGSHTERHIHVARTSVKRLRSMLRLTRDAFPAPVYREENATLRAAGRALAAARDATVMAAAVDALADSDGLDETTLGRLRQRVAAARESANAGLDESAEIAVSALEGSRARLAELTSEDGAAVSLDAVLHGLRRTYRRGRAAGRLAGREPSTGNLHAWRRRVKDLRHHAELLRDVDPAILKKVRRHARALSDLLGDDHDLAVLRDQFAPDDAAVAAAIDRRRAELQKDAFALGARLYAGSPRKLMRRVGESARKRTDWKPARVS